MSRFDAHSAGSELPGEEADIPSDDAAGMRQRIANSSLWSLLLGGRPLPFREAEELPSLEVSRLSDGSGLRVTGELDVLSVLTLEEALAAAHLPVPIVLDLSGVTFMDGVGISLLLQLARAGGGAERVILRNPSRSVTRVLSIAIPDGEPGLEIRAE